jgi:hypothetical protein
MVDFGLKPTIRVNHAVTAPGRTARGHEYGTVAINRIRNAIPRRSHQRVITHDVRVHATRHV